MLLQWTLLALAVVHASLAKPRIQGVDGRAPCAHPMTSSLGVQRQAGGLMSAYTNEHVFVSYIMRSQPPIDPDDPLVCVFRANTVPGISKGVTRVTELLHGCDDVPRRVVLKRVSRCRTPDHSGIWEVSVVKQSEQQAPQPPVWLEFFVHPEDLGALPSPRVVAAGISASLITFDLRGARLLPRIADPVNPSDLLCLVDLRHASAIPPGFALARSLPTEKEAFVFLSSQPNPLLESVESVYDVSITRLALNATQDLGAVPGAKSRRFAVPGTLQDERLLCSLPFPFTEVAGVQAALRSPERTLLLPLREPWKPFETTVSGAVVGDSRVRCPSVTGFVLDEPLFLEDASTAKRQLSRVGELVTVDPEYTRRTLCDRGGARRLAAFFSAVYQGQAVNRGDWVEQTLLQEAAPEYAAAVVFAAHGVERVIPSAISAPMARGFVHVAILGRGFVNTDDLACVANGRITFDAEFVNRTAVICAMELLKIPQGSPDEPWLVQMTVRMRGVLASRAASLELLPTWESVDLPEPPAPPPAKEANPTEFSVGAVLERVVLETDQYGGWLSGRQSVHVAGDFSVFAEYLWSVVCAYKRKTGASLVRVVSHVQPAVVECPLPGNFTFADFENSVQLLAVRSDSGEQTMSIGSAVPFSLRPLLVLYTASPDWTLWAPSTRGAPLEVEVRGRWFPEDFELFCMFGGRVLSEQPAVRINEELLRCVFPPDKLLPSDGGRSTLHVLYSRDMLELEYLPTLNFTQVVFPSVARVFVDGVPLDWLAEDDNTLRLDADRPALAVALQLSAEWSREKPLTVQLRSTLEADVVLVSITEVDISISRWVNFTVPALASKRNFTAQLVGVFGNSEQHKTVLVEDVEVFIRPSSPMQTEVVAETGYNLTAVSNFWPYIEVALDVIEYEEVAEDFDWSSLASSHTDEVFWADFPVRQEEEYSAWCWVEDDTSQPAVRAKQVNASVVICPVDASLNLTEIWTNIRIFIGAKSPIDDYIFYPGLLLSGVPSSCRYSFEPKSCAPFASHYRPMHEILYGLTEVLPEFEFLAGAPGSVSVLNVSEHTQSFAEGSLWTSDGRFREVRNFMSLNFHRLLYAVYPVTDTDGPFVLYIPPDWFKNEFATSRVYPDWGVVDGGDVVTMRGYYASPFPFNRTFAYIATSDDGTADFSSAAVVAGEYSGDYELRFPTPAVSQVGNFQFYLDAHFIGPMNTTHILVTNELSQFIYASSFAFLSTQATPEFGPAGGTTNVSFLVEVTSGATAGALTQYFDCAFGDVSRVPAFVAFQPELTGANGGEVFGISCIAPPAPPLREVCVQLVPSAASYLRYPTLQPDCDLAHSVKYTFYRQVPRVVELIPSQGTVSGGTPVTVRVVNMPEEELTVGVICRFDVFEFAGEIDFAASTVVCMSPSMEIERPPGSDPLVPVEVALSFNGGFDFTEPATFVYMPPFLISSIYPPFGPLTGGTPLLFTVATGDTKVMDYVRFICFNDVLVEARRVSLFQVVAEAPMSPTLNPDSGVDPVQYPLGYTVGLGIQQLDGRCFPKDEYFTYVQSWKAKAFYTTQTGAGGANTDGRRELVLWGENFQRYASARCRFRVHVPAGIAAEYQDLRASACWLFGEAVVHSESRVTCTLDVREEYWNMIDRGCNGALLSQMQDVHPRQKAFMNALSLEVEVSINGVDFALVEDEDASGTPMPWVISLFREPVIRKRSSLWGLDVGGYDVSVAIPSGSMFSIRSCRFQRQSDTHWFMLSPARPESTRSIRCQVPRWRVAGERGRQANETVQIALGYEENKWSNSTSFVYVRSPAITSISPLEGPETGGTRVTVSGEGFSRVVPSMDLKCRFGEVLVDAIYHNDTSVACFSPFLATAVEDSTDPSSGDLVVFQLEAGGVPLRGEGGKEVTFFYRSTALRVTHVSPLSGPIEGGTLVSVWSERFIENTGLLGCLFGSVRVEAIFVNPLQITCEAPSFASAGPGLVSLRISTDGDDTTGVDLYAWNAVYGKNDRVMYEFYFSPTGAGLTPGFGSSSGGTLVMIRGTHFRYTDNLSCQFGLTVVKATRFVSENAIVCETPPLGQGGGVVQVRLSNNGRDFSKGDEFIYINSEPALLMDPYLGPVTGGTEVVITIADPELLPADVWTANLATCYFGTSIVPATRTSASAAALKCQSPSNPKPGYIDVFVSLNGQDKIATLQKFLFYEDPEVHSVSPAFAARGERNYLTLRGKNFFNTHALQVRFGNPPASSSVSAIWINSEELRVLAPIVEPEGSEVLRLPLFVSNNGQNFAPLVDAWSPDEEVAGLKHFTFHPAASLTLVVPEFANLHGGGYVAVHGGPFLDLAHAFVECSFDWVYGVKAADAVVVSTSLMLCGVPDMWEAHQAFNLTAKLRVTVNGEQWSNNALDFHFLPLSPVGHFTYHLTADATSDAATLQDSTAAVKKCGAGEFCEEPGLSVPSDCPVGHYQKYEGRAQCVVCPRGHFCSRKRMHRPEKCPAGWVCDADGLAVPSYRCGGGFICLPGTSDWIVADSWRALASTPGVVPMHRKPLRSPRGQFVLPGSGTLRSSPGNFSTPQPCFQGHFCPPGSSTPYGVGSCPLGRYCPSPAHSGILCPARFACGPLPGQFEPLQCTAGTWNGLVGQHNCTLSSEGGIVPAPALDAAMASECGYVALRKGVSVLSANEMCPAGRVCGTGVATPTEPKICEPTTANNATSGRTMCLASLGQVYVHHTDLVLNAPRVAEELGSGVHACCWSYAKVDEFLGEIEEFYASFPLVELKLEAHELTTLRQALAAAHTDRLTGIESSGFDGSILLGNFTDSTLFSDWDIQIATVRAKIMFELERSWAFRGPSVCPRGAFCNAGACANVPTIIIDPGDGSGTDAGSRRLLEDNGDGAQVPADDLLIKRPYLINFPVFAPPRLLADEDETDPLQDLRSLAALKAPQQCLAGTYCNERANSSTGSGLCPVGFFCYSGAEDPIQAPAGQFVGEAGRVRGRECTPGSFAPEPSLPFCLGCSPGYSCPSFGTQTPRICSTGTYRASSGLISSVFDDFSLENAETSISCNPCPEGTWTAQRGTPDETACSPCPAGRICLQKTGNLTQTNPCPEGFMCAEGSTLTTASEHLCLDGFFCGQGTTPKTVYEFLCNAGFYCGEGTTFANRFTFRCSLGFTCPTGTGYKEDMSRTLTPNTAYLRPGHFYLLQVVGQYCLRQAQLVQYNQVKATNEALARAGLSPLLDQEVQERLSAWTSLTVTCVQEQIEYIPNLAVNAEAVSEYLYTLDTWHSKQLLQYLAKPTYSYSNKCINDTFPRFEQDTSFQCLCEVSAQNGELVKCLTRAEPPFYSTPIGAPFLFTKDTALDSTSCSPYPDCIDWARLDNYNGEPTQTSGPKNGPYKDDFDMMAVPYIEYVKSAIEREMQGFLDSEASSLTSCPLGTMTQEDGAEGLQSCEKRAVLENLGDSVDMSIYRVNPVNRFISNDFPYLGKIKEWEEDLRLAYNVSARAMAKITIDLRHLPEEMEYGRDWIIRIYSNSSMSPETDDPWYCEEAWLKFFDERMQADELDITDTELGIRRVDRTLDRNCSMLYMPLGFESYMRSLGSVCPSTTDSVCYALNLPRDPDMSSCRGAEDKASISSEDKLVHEFYFHPLVDQLLRIEVVIVNGMFASDRFHFVRTVRVEIQQPSRAILGTANTYVIEFSSDLTSVVYAPFNLPTLPMANSSYENKYAGNSSYASAQTPLIAGGKAISQTHVLTRAFLGWLPKNVATKLTNCMRHGDDYEEFMIYSRYWLSQKQTIWQTHIPFFSNCRGFGTAVPLWQLIERSENCVHVNETETVPIYTTSFGQAPFGDSCVQEVECMLDEVPNSKQSITRWFEAATGVTLFRISRQAYSNGEYAQISGPIQDSIPVVLRSGAKADGSLPSVVGLKLWYWQKSPTEKLVIKADVTFDKFAMPTNEQSRGSEPWVYDLKVSWAGMSHIEVLVNYAFPFSFYLVFFSCMGLLGCGVAALHLFFNRMTVNKGSVTSMLLDSRYVKFVTPPMLRGFALAVFPCIPGILVAMALIQGELAGYKLPFYSCDEQAVANDPLSKGCKYGLLDGYVSSFSSDSLSYQQRRDGRSAVLFMVIGGYVLLLGIKMIIPSIDSKFYEEKNGEDEDEDEEDQKNPKVEDDGSSSEESGMEEEGARVAAKDEAANAANAGADDDDEDEGEQIFSPNLWKRSAYFTVVSMVILLCTVFLEFSYSETYTAICWFMPVIFYVFQLGLETILSGVFHETLLSVPIQVLYQVCVSITLLATPDLYTFVLISFEQLGLQMLDRIYVSPNQRFIAGRLTAMAKSFISTVRWITSGKVAEGRYIGHQHLLIGAEGGEGDGDSSADDDDGDALVMPGTQRGGDLGSATEFMLWFLQSQAVDAMESLLVPFCVLAFRWVYTPTQTLNYYNVSADQTAYYVTFYITQCVFKAISDLIVMNSAEAFWGWKLLDYMEYCNYRYSCRPHRMKGEGETFDETLAPALRSLDAMCFSDQFYFKSFLTSFGAFLILLGVQVAVNNAWNVFEDPASGLILLIVALVGRVFKTATVTTADYLKVWFVTASQVTESNKSIQDLTSTVNKGEDLVRPPATSVLFNWPEPSDQDEAGLERYREAFLKENQLWLQHSFELMIDEVSMAQYRKTLLSSLAGVLGEVDPDQYVPDTKSAALPVGAPPAGVLTFGSAPAGPAPGALVVAPARGAPTAGALAVTAAPLPSSGVVAPLVHFAFDTEPPHESAAVFANRQRSQFTDTDIQALVQLWLARARFLLRVRAVSRAIRPDQSRLSAACETCKKAGKEAGLAVSPVFTLTHLASEFRRQREMSPLWNMEMWRNFYQRFTPTCTVCTECAVKFWERNIDIPVDEPRLQRLRLSSKSSVQLLRESPFGVTAVVDKKDNPFLRKWLTIAERVQNGEDWREFLPDLGYAADAEVAEEELPEQHKKVVLSSDDDSEEEAKRRALKKPVQLSNPAVVRLSKRWAEMARRNVKYPNIRDYLTRKAAEDLAKEREAARRRQEEEEEARQAAKRKARKDNQGF